MTDPSERYLVTGSMGCLGSWTVRRLIDLDLNVVAFDLSADTRRLELLASAAELERVTFVRGDITDLSTVAEVVERHHITRIIHCAALQIPFVRANPSLGARVNVVGTVNVFEAAAANPGQVLGLAYASAAGVFGPPDLYPGSTVVDDSAQMPSTLYGVFKQADEQIARIYWSERGLSSVGLRPWIIYGPGRDQGMTSDVTVAMLAAAARVPYRIGFGGESLFQFAPDVAAAFVAAAQAGLQGAETFNLGGETASIERIVDLLAEIEPTSREQITFDPTPLPVVSRVNADRFERMVAAPPFVSLAAGTERSVATFRELLGRNLVKPPS
jgi:UDP-glucuronate 4-epimerase